MIAAGVLLITPGPAVLYIVARSIHQGRMAGLVSALGLATGTLFHIAAAAQGLSALLLSSALAFQTLKDAGAAYLIYLGIQKLRSGDQIRNGIVEFARGTLFCGNCVYRPRSHDRTDRFCEEKLGAVLQRKIQPQQDEIEPGIGESGIGLFEALLIHRNEAVIG